MAEKVIWPCLALITCPYCCTALTNKTDHHFVLSLLPGDSFYHSICHLHVYQLAVPVLHGHVFYFVLQEHVPCRVLELPSMAFSHPAGG